MKPIFLGVNIDHVATVRNARGTNYPDPVTAAAIAELAGADSITTHLREDRRHITDRDVRIIRETVKTSLNLEMAVTDEILAIAVAVAPQKVCMVPERREEVTTEGRSDATLIRVVWMLCGGDGFVGPSVLVTIRRSRSGTTAGRGGGDVGRWWFRLAVSASVNRHLF